MGDWLVGIFGDASATAVFWFIILIGIAFLVWFVLRLYPRLTPGTFVSGGRGHRPRLTVTDATPVDNQRRLVLVRRDNVEHLLLIGGPTDVVVESNIPAVDVAEPRSRPERTPPASAPSARQTPVVKPSASTPARSPEPSQSRPAPRSEPSMTREPAVQLAEAPAASDPAAEPFALQTERQAPVQVDDTPAASIEPPESPVAVRGTTFAASPPAMVATAVTGIAASQSPARNEPASEIENELSGVLDHDNRQERAKADPSLEDEMSKLLNQLSSERK